MYNYCLITFYENENIISSCLSSLRILLALGEDIFMLWWSDASVADVCPCRHTIPLSLLLRLYPGFLGRATGHEILSDGSIDEIRANRTADSEVDDIYEVILGLCNGWLLWHMDRT